MNILTSLSLSKEEEYRIRGIFINHFVVKRSAIKDASIVDGLNWHQKITTFSRNHGSFIECKEMLPVRYYGFGNEIVEMFFDHFLAKEWSNNQDKDLPALVGQWKSIATADNQYYTKHAKAVVEDLFDKKVLLNYSRLEGMMDAIFLYSRHNFMHPNIASSFVSFVDIYKEFSLAFEKYYADLKQYNQEMEKSELVYKSWH